MPSRVTGRSLPSRRRFSPAAGYLWQSWWNASVSHNVSECLCLKSRCTNLSSQSSEREKILTSGCHFWRPGHPRSRRLRFLVTHNDDILRGRKTQHVWKVPCWLKHFLRCSPTRHFHSVRCVPRLRGRHDLSLPWIPSYCWRPIGVYRAVTHDMAPCYYGYY